MDQAGALQVTLLNGVEVRWAGQSQPLGPPQRRAVLCALALRRRQWISAAGLLDGLYDDEPPASGIGVIQTYVSALRRILEPERTPRTPPTVLLSGHGGYQLRIDDEQIDVGVFDRFVAEAVRARQAADWAGAERNYAQALALCSGEPLAGIPGPFAEVQRAALTERRLAVMEDSLDVAVLLGRTDEAIDALRTLTAEQPLRERPRAVLMRALTERGRRSEALEVYRDTRRVLVDQLGVEPGAELRRLHEQILTGAEPAERPRPVATVRKTDDVVPEDDSSLPQVFDRERELTRITACVRRAGTGVGGLVVIAGRPGHGKTQLLNEVARQHPSALRVDLTAVSGAEDLIGQLLQRLGAQDDADADDKALADQLFGAIGRKSADEPLVILIDDATRMDDRSARALATLAPRLRGLSALIVLTLDERSWDKHALDLHDRLEPLASEVLRPGGLTAKGIAGLYERRVGAPCPPELAEDILRASGGIPLVAGALITDLDNLRIRTRVPDQLPEGCYSRSIQRQLERYSPEGARTLRALAVLQEFHPTVEILAAACDEPVPVMRHRCELLAAIGLLVVPDPPELRHPLIANTIRWLCPTEDAAAFRTRAAARARVAGYSARQVARYLADLTGTQYARWTLVLVDAAEDCLSRNLIPEAAHWLEAALRICPPQDRDDLMVRLGQLELWTNPAAARAHLEEALEGQRTRGVSPTALIPLTWTMGVRRDAAAAMALLKEVLAETEARDPVAARAIRATAWVVRALSPATWREYIAELHAEPAGDCITAAALTWDDAFGTRIDARTALERVSPQRLDYDLTLPTPLLGLVTHLTMWGGELTSALHLTELRGDEHFGAIDTYRLIVRSEILIRQGAYEQVLDEVGSMIGAIDDELITPPMTLVAQYAHALLGLGRTQEAERWLDRRTARANSETWELTVVIHIRALLAAERGASREAIAHFMECGRRTAAVGINNPAHIPWRSSAALELVRLGERDRARELAATELALAQRWNTPATLGRAMRAMALAAPEATDTELLTRAVELLRTDESPVELIPALLDLARACDDPEQARLLLWEARDHTESLGATGYAAAIEELLTGPLTGAVSGHRLPD